MAPLIPGTARRLGLRQPNTERFNKVIDLWMRVFAAKVGEEVAEAVRAEVAASQALEAIRADHEARFAKRVDRAVQVVLPIFDAARRATHPR